MSMTTLKPDFFAWEMLYNSIERAIIRKTDVIIALAHFVLLKHGEFRCLGLGEDQILKPNEVGMELLPEGWNYDPDKYALRYKRGYDLYVLIGQKHDDIFELSLLDVGNDKVSNVSLEAESLVQKIRGSITDLMPTAGHIAIRIRQELIDAVYPASTCEITTQTNPDDCEKCEHSDEQLDQLHDFKCMHIGGTRTVCAQCSTSAATQM